MRNQNELQERLEEVEELREFFGHLGPDWKYDLQSAGVIEALEYALGERDEIPMIEEYRESVLSEK